MNRTITKPASVRALGPVDIKPLKALVNRLTTTVWSLENERKENAFFCFHHTQHIVFRFIHQNQDATAFYSNPIWNIWQPSLLPVMTQAAATYRYLQPVYPKVMLAKLAAGHTIDRHIDGAGSNLCTHKIHVPLQTNSQVDFLINDVPYHLEAGQAYEVNNIVPHGVKNKGTEDRIHLIFELFDGTNAT